MFHFPNLSLSLSCSYSPSLADSFSHFVLVFAVCFRLSTKLCPANFAVALLLFIYFLGVFILSQNAMQEKVSEREREIETREVFYFSPELSSTIIHYFSFFLTISSSLSQIVVFKYRLCGGRSIYLINHSICINQHLRTHRVIS